MPDQNHSDEFNQAIAVLEGRRQAAHQAAVATFQAAYEKLWADHRVARAVAFAAFDAVKGNPAHPGHDAARAALAALDRAPDDRAIRGAHDRAIRAADDAYNAEAARLRHQFQFAR